MSPGLNTPIFPSFIRAPFCVGADGAVHDSKIPATTPPNKLRPSFRCSMSIYLIVLVTVLTHTSFKGSKVLVSLYAIDLGASPLTIGVLFSMYSLFPVVLSVYAGKLSDRYGYRAPMLF